MNRRASLFLLALLLSWPALGQTVPSPDLRTMANKAGTTYNAANSTILYAEDVEAIKDRLVDATASVNCLDLWLGGVERYTDDGDLLARGLYSNGTSGAIPSGYSGIGSFFGYYPGKQALYGGTWTAASGGGSGLVDANVGTRSIAWGYDVESSGLESVVIGRNSSAQGDQAVAIGNGAIAVGSEAYAFGSYVKARYDTSIVIGSGVFTGDELTDDGISDGIIIFGAQSDLPTLSIFPDVVGGVGTVGRIGLGLGATAPTAFADVAASTAGRSSLRLRHGTAPSSPNDGDIWTTTGGLYARINGGTVGPLISASGAPVASVFGRTGAVAATANDYTWAQVDKTTSSLADITTRSAGDLSSGTLNDGRLSANVPLLNAANSWTASQTIGDAYQVKWSDVGLERGSAGVVDVTDGSTGLGSVTASRVMLDGTGSAYIDTDGSSGKLRLYGDNGGGSAQQHIELYAGTASISNISLQGWSVFLQGASGGLGLGNGHSVMWADTSTNGSVAGSVGLTWASSGVLKVRDSSTGTGSLVVGGAAQLQLVDTGSRPTCDATSRGTVWYDAGGAGVADTIEICGKSAADSYSWVALATF